MDRQAITSVLAKTRNNDYWLERIQQGGCFILAEAVSNEGVLGLADELSGGRSEKCRLYWGEAGRMHASISPYLLPVTIDNWPQLKEEVCSVDHWGVAIVLDAKQRALPPAQQFNGLLHHLRQWTLVKTETNAKTQAEGNNGQQVLRLSDWQVLSTLLQASTELEQSALFGPVDQFMFTANADTTAESEKEKDSQWQALQVLNNQALNNQGGQGKTEGQANSPNVLSPPQQLALDKMSQLEHYKTYQAHLHQHHAESQSWSDDDMLHFIEQRLLVAKQHDFTNPQDKIRFLSLSMVCGDDFIEQQWAQTVLAKHKQKGGISKMDQLHEAAIAQL
ncbi:DUF4123 domain-containing protein [uncultured Shewanella sp.]|uniref:DUF4123 domain-containing protein n=1 Tax=uncultured Shewanella sp. TaxID=173975 RepID=UPI0026022F4D|nr:DUF4123 domain-containing protein [uncultured Shewanella sp.]